MSVPEPFIESILTDLNGTSLEDLRTSKDSDLQLGVDRLLDRIDDPDNRFGGHTD